MKSSWQVATAAEAFTAAQFARCGWDVSVQYGANQPEYDLVGVDGDRILKVSVAERTPQLALRIEVEHRIGTKVQRQSPIAMKPGNHRLALADDDQLDALNERRRVAYQIFTVPLEAGQRISTPEKP